MFIKKTCILDSNETCFYQSLYFIWVLKRFIDSFKHSEKHPCLVVYDWNSFLGELCGQWISCELLTAIKKWSNYFRMLCNLTIKVCIKETSLLVVCYYTRCSIIHQILPLKDGEVVECKYFLSYMVLSQTLIFFFKNVLLS